MMMMDLKNIISKLAAKIPLQFNITGDPKKDAEYVLIALAACIILLIIVIFTIILLVLRKKKKAKASANIQTQNNKEALDSTIEKSEIKQEIVQTPEPKIEPETVKEKEVPVPPIQNTETTPDTKPINKDEAYMPTAGKTNISENLSSKSSPIEEKEPEDKMEEIRKRLAEIAQNKKNNPSDYQEIILPKLTADFAKTVSKEDAALQSESFEEHETEEIPSAIEEISNKEIYNDERKSQALETDFVGNPVSDSDYEAEIDEFNNDPGLTDKEIYNEERKKDSMDTDFVGNPVSDSDYKSHIEEFTDEIAIEHIHNANLAASDEIQIEQEETDFSGEPVSDSHFHTDSTLAPEKLNQHFQNSQLPLKRLTFAEWMDNFKP